MSLKYEPASEQVQIACPHAAGARLFTLEHPLLLTPGSGQVRVATSLRGEYLLGVNFYDCEETSSVRPATLFFLFITLEPRVE